jgi:hypothetical protein
MSTCADSICYDGYDLNHKTKSITIFLRDSVWCRPNVWWHNSWTCVCVTFCVVCFSLKQIRDLCLGKKNIVWVQIYNNGILDSSFSVTIFNVWTTQAIYFGCMTCISAMCIWHSAFHLKKIGKTLRKHVYNTNNTILEIVSQKSTSQSSLLQNGIKIMQIKC